MNTLKRLAGILFLLLLLLSSCKASNDSVVIEPEKTLQIFVDDELFSADTITITEGQSVTIQFAWSNGDSLDVDFSDSENLDISYFRYYDILEIDVSYWHSSSSESVSFYDADNDNLLKTLEFNILDLPYLYIPSSGYSNIGSVTHGEENSIYLSTNLPNEKLTWSVSGTGSGEVVKTDDPETVTVKGLSPGTITLEVSYTDDPSVNDSYEIEVLKRDIEITTTSYFKNFLFVGESLNIGDIFTVQYTTSPGISIAPPSQDLTVSSSESTLSISDDTLEAISAGSTLLTVVSGYNSNISEEYGLQTMGTSTDLTLSGYVTDGRGSYIVAGSTVELFENESDTVMDSTLSDTDGSFSFSGLDTGFYDIEVSGSGRAASRMEHLFLGDKDRNIELVQKEMESQNWGSDAPSITMELQDEYLIIDDDISFLVSVSGGNMFMAAGSRYTLAYSLACGDGEAQLISATDDEQMDIDVDTFGLANDEFYEIVLVAYDINNNRCEYRIPLERTSINGTIYDKPGSSTYRQICITSETYGTRRNVFSAGNNSYHSVNVCVERSYSGSYEGINVYRSSVSGTPGILIGSSSNIDSGSNLGVYEDFVSSLSWFYFKDTDPALTPGETYYYTMSYIGEGNESDRSVEVEITILPSYNLELIGPANGSNVTGDPTFTWQEISDNALWSGLTVDEQNIFMLVSADTMDIAYADAPSSDLTYTLPETLNSNIRYEWDVLSMKSIEHISTYTYSFSASMPRVPIYSPHYASIIDAALPLSNNGSYSFYQE